MALLCLLLATGYLLVATPLLDFYREREAGLADKRMLALRLRATADALPELRAQLAALKASASTRKISLDGGSDAIAAANLQSEIEQLATSTGVTIGSTEAIAAESRGSHRRIGLRLAVNGPYAAVVSLLGAIEKATPPLVLGNLQIHAMMRPIGDTSNARLEAAFEVYGFRATEPLSPPQQ